ncbi:MAG: hypothetical protein L3J71_07995 [Victivallaceae bacterium]|nr:hypothetical protein [Victivallaceae bacterium]
MENICSEIKSFKTLDYVTCWYIKAAQYIQGTDIKVAFVSTNSISQGEQVSILWNELLDRYKIKIHFAHRIFFWTNEAAAIPALFAEIRQPVNNYIVIPRVSSENRSRNRGI